MTCYRPGMGCSLPSMSFRWLRLAKDELRDKTALLDKARREASEAVN